MRRVAFLFILAGLFGCAAHGAPLAAVAASAEPEPAPVAADAGEAAPEQPCDVIGAWRGRVGGGILEGETMDLVFAEDGTARGTVGWVTLETRWVREGEHVLITDVRAIPALASCPPDVVGRYRIEFAPACVAVHVVEGEDPCRHRYLALVGLEGRRL